MIEGTTSVFDPAYFGDIQVFGNPVATNLRILTEKEVDEVFIFNSSGQQVRQKTSRRNNLEISMEEFTPGMYFVILKSGLKLHTLKVIKR